jgi:hypothetical protein
MFFPGLGCDDVAGVRVTNVTDHIISLRLLLLVYFGKKPVHLFYGLNGDLVKLYAK